MLEQYYSELEPYCPPNAVTNQLFPYPMSYNSLSTTTTIKFQYNSPVVNGKLIFFAMEESSKDTICVKFVQSYSKEAHECFFSLGHAPALQGYQKLTSGGWIMVVFDTLIGFETLHKHTKKQPLSDTVFRDITRTLKRFHSLGFVHGDICDVNIMVSKSEEPMKFIFVDFDWSGKVADVVRYPSCMNTRSIMRPKDALWGKRITQAHDIFMLNQLKSALIAMWSRTRWPRAVSLCTHLCISFFSLSNENLVPPTDDVHGQPKVHWVTKLLQCLVVLKYVQYSMSGCGSLT